MAVAVEIRFRVWMHPEDGDPPQIEVWFDDLEPTEPRRRFYSEWAQETLQNEDFRALFDLPPDGHWQVVGRGMLHGRYMADGEYDEDFTVTHFTKAPVPLAWYAPEDCG